MVRRPEVVDGVLFLQQAGHSGFEHVAALVSVDVGYHAEDGGTSLT